MVVEAKWLSWLDAVKAYSALIDWAMKKLKTLWLLDNFSDLYLWKNASADDIPQNELSKVKQLVQAFDKVLKWVEGDGWKQWDKLWTVQPSKWWS